jgi:hypothetical protein
LQTESGIFLFVDYTMPGGPWKERAIAIYACLIPCPTITQLEPYAFPTTCLQQPYNQTNTLQNNKKITKIKLYSKPKRAILTIQIKKFNFIEPNMPMLKNCSASVLILALISTLSGGFVTIPVTALASTWTTTPEFVIAKPDHELSLADFIQSVYTGDRNSLAGIYIPGVLSLPVGQQPSGNAGYVTRESNQVTQFGLASQYGTVGLLAHNDLAGAQFSNINIEQYAILVYGDGSLEYYTINEIQQYQALSPTSTYSDFINLADTNERLSATSLFNRVYAPGQRLVLQTCIAGFGDASWGRMFIIATPANSQVLSVVEQTTRILEFASFGLVSY